MSPELFDPPKPGLKEGRRTKYSDCYALGMVMYEVLTGHAPFPDCGILAVVTKVSKGERPRRPRDAERTWFKDDIWNLLERCWKRNPEHRPNIADVLRCLKEFSKSWRPPSPQTLSGPSITDPLSWNPWWSSSGSAGEDEMSSYRAVPSQKSRDFLPQGNTSDKTHILTPFDILPVLQEVDDHRVLRSDPSEADPEFPKVFDRVGWKCLFNSQPVALTCRLQGSPP